MSTANDSVDSEGVAKALSAQSVKLGIVAIYLIVCVSGAVLMGIEIAGSRILAPAHGTSIFVWGSLIGLFMTAMALGYWLGGKLADRSPSFGILAGLVSASGLWTVVVLNYIGPQLSDKISQAVPKTVAPLVTSAALFFVPIFFMAMVSPFAVKLRARSLTALGEVAGWLYALSTLGSIAGTLGTTFALVPYFKVSHILIGMGIALIIVAAVSWALFTKAVSGYSKSETNGIATMALLALVCGLGWWLFPPKPAQHPGSRVLTYVESPYHDIAVTEECINVNGDNSLVPPERIARWLKFNENLESGIFPYCGEFKNAVHYTDLLHLSLIWVPQPKRMLIVGAGGGVVPMQFSSHYDKFIEQIDVVDIDQRVIDTAKNYFMPAGWDKHITYHNGDGRVFLSELKDQSYDIVLLDAYSSGGQIPYHLLTWEYLKQVKQKLRPGGVLITNIISAVENRSDNPERTADLFLAEYKTLSASEAQAKGNPALDNTPLFKELYVFPKVWETTLNGNEDTYRNVIVFATDDAKRKDKQEDIVPAANALMESKVIKIPLNDFVPHAERMYDKKPQIDDSIPIFTDEFAPVDRMYRPVRRDETTFRWRN